MDACNMFEPQVSFAGTPNNTSSYLRQYVKFFRPSIRQGFSTNRNLLAALFIKFRIVHIEVLVV